MFLKKQSNKKPPMGELYYPRPMTSMFQHSPSFTFFLLAAISYDGQSNFKFEYLGEFVTVFENILEYESGAQVCSFEEKSGGRKSRATVPLKLKNLYTRSFSTARNQHKYLRLYCCVHKQIFFDSV